MSGMTPRLAAGKTIASQRCTYGEDSPVFRLAVFVWAHMHCPTAKTMLARLLLDRFLYRHDWVTAMRPGLMIGVRRITCATIVAGTWWQSGIQLSIQFMI
jgi:hypothetical protein